LYSNYYIFFVGQPTYKIVKPAGTNSLSLLFKVLGSAFRQRRKLREEGLPFLDYAKKEHNEKDVDDIKQVLSVLKVFLAIPVFWALFDQHSSRWVFQAERLNLEIVKGWTLEASQIQILNPGMLLILIGLTSKVLYPLLERYGINMTPLFHKMGIGMLFSSLSFISSAILEWYIESSPKGTVAWYYIVPQFLLLSIGEVFVSVTGLEFAYSQAPKEMKGIVMACWSFTVAIGNLLVALVALINMTSMIINFCLYAILMNIMTVIFLIVNKNFKYNTRY